MHIRAVCCGAPYNSTLARIMSNPPYAPPGARVSDPARPPVAKPLSLRRAIACLWASVFITAIGTVLLIAGVLPSSDLGKDIFVTLGSIALCGFVAEKLRFGRGWARWAYVAVWVLGSFIGMIAAALAPQAFLSLPTIAQAAFVAQFIVQTTALWLMFTPESRLWFRSL